MSDLTLYAVSMGFRDAWDLVGVLAGIVFIVFSIITHKE